MPGLLRVRPAVTSVGLADRGFHDVPGSSRASTTLRRERFSLDLVVRHEEMFDFINQIRIEVFKGPDIVMRARFDSDGDDYDHDLTEERQRQERGNRGPGEEPGFGQGA